MCSSRSSTERTQLLRQIIPVTGVLFVVAGFLLKVFPKHYHGYDTIDTTDTDA